jgi:uncharacterized membrane protein
MEGLGEIAEWIAALGCGIIIITYIVGKHVILINKHNSIVKFIKKHHPLIGILILVAANIHFVVMCKIEKLSISGLIAFGILCMTIISGIIRNKCHKILPIILLIAIIIHIA